MFWSLFFIFLLYFTAPALAVLVKYEIYNILVGTRSPTCRRGWRRGRKIDPTLISITDINRDGIVQLAEIALGQDIIVLATPEIAGLPYVISGLVAAGGLAAALSTADGLLLTIANALSHDLYYKMIDPNASTQKRVTISKILLLVVALVAAYVTSLKPGDILFLVGAAFSLAAAAFFPALVLGVFWKRANKWGAIAGMVAGPRHHVLLHGARRYPWLRRRLGVNPADRRRYVVRHPADLGRRSSASRSASWRSSSSACSRRRPTSRRRTWSSTCAIRTCGRHGRFTGALIRAIHGTQARGAPRAFFRPWHASI